MNYWEVNRHHTLSMSFEFLSVRKNVKERCWVQTDYLPRYFIKSS